RWVRASRATLAPACQKRSAIARPSPRFAPVITTTCPLKSSSEAMEGWSSAIGRGAIVGGDPPQVKFSQGDDLHRHGANPFHIAVRLWGDSCSTSVHRGWLPSQVWAAAQVAGNGRVNVAYRD